MLNGFTVEDVRDALQYVPAERQHSELNKRAHPAAWTDALRRRLRQ